MKSGVTQWNPESRYELPGGVTQTQAVSMIENASKVIGVLL